MGFKGSILFCALFILEGCGSPATQKINKRNTNAIDTTSQSKSGNLEIEETGTIDSDTEEENKIPEEGGDSDNSNENDQAPTSPEQPEPEPEPEPEQPDEGGGNKPPESTPLTRGKIIYDTLANGSPTCAGGCHGANKFRNLNLDRLKEEFLGRRRQHGSIIDVYSDIEVDDLLTYVETI